MPPPRPPKPHLLLLLLVYLLVIDCAAAWRPPPSRPHHRAAAAAQPESTQQRRRDALQGQLATAASLSLLLLGTTPTPGPAAVAMAAPTPERAVREGAVWILGGFQIPAAQYGAYAERLREAGLARVYVRADGTGLDGSNGDGADAENVDVVQRYEQEALSVAREIVTEQQRQQARTTATATGSVLLVGHSRGGALAVRVAHALQGLQGRQAPQVAGLVLLDPVDYPPAKGSSERQQSPASSSTTTTTSCLPLLPTLRRIRVPVAVAALPYSGVSRYYKSKNKNLCAPPGRDALAFYHAAGGSEDGAVVLVSLPEAGHLQLLQRRAELPFAEMCGVGTRLSDEKVLDLCANLVVACALRWVGGEEGVGLEEGLVKGGGGGRAGFRPVDPDLAGTVVWGMGG